MQDLQLVRRILSGDQSAMRDLIIKYQDLVVNTCFQILHNPVDAEDMAQEVFIEAYRSMSSLRQEQQLSYWLYRIALNKSINLQKKNRLLRGFLRLDNPCDAQRCEAFLFEAQHHEDPYQTILRNEQMQVVRQVLASLPARQQKAFVLHHFEKLSYKEIAQILEVSLSTVESLIFRAKNTLRQKCRHLYLENPTP